MGELPDSQLIARQLARLSVQQYASPRYLQLAGEPAHPDDLVRHECIGFPKAGPWVLHRQADIVEVAVGGRFLVNSVGMCRRLATLDLGIIMLPRGDRRGGRGGRAAAQDIAGLERTCDSRLRDHGNPSAARKDTAVHRVFAGAIRASAGSKR
jgi:DNA-binding transcriptional LysR family regulator